MPGLNTSSTDNFQVWTPARVYSAYRVILASLLLVLFLSTRDMPLIGSNEPRLFLHTAIVYLILVIAPLFFPASLHDRRMLTLVPVSIDIVALSLMVHASGGIGSNLTVLLLVTVASGSILLPGRLGLLVAAMATLAVMFEQFYFSLGESVDNPFQLTESALLGLAFFATSLITQQVTQRLVRSESLAASQRLAISRLEAINQQVVARMRTGVLVFDESHRVILFNQSAEQLFDRPLDGQRLPQPILDSYRDWRRNPARHRAPVVTSSQAPPQDIGFADLSDSGIGLCIAFLEDRSQMLQQAQQMKLAALGRMSATIAHEIRNPLSAINHAAQLLDDGEKKDEDSRLLLIIQNHVGRVNRIIDDILNLSRRNDSRSQLLKAGEVLRDASKRWQEQGQPLTKLKIECPDEHLTFRFDPLQLHQVLDNLISNAIRHASDTDIEITTGLHSRTGLPWLRVRDFGPGVTEEVREQLFEPFYTTSREGTGLGLFLCRELCEANQARLDFEPANPGASFVITFSHPDRVFE